MNKLFTFYFLLFTSFISLLLAETIEIKQDGTGNFTTIQEGIIAATDADTVLVYPGIYFENIDFIGKDITVASLLLTTGDESYIDSTIIDGNQQGSVVTFENDETNYAVLMGLTIQNGGGTPVAYSFYGGGIYIDKSSPHLQKLNIINNKASLGAGIMFSSTDATLEFVTIKENHGYSHGGGIAIIRKAPDPWNSNITFHLINKNNIFNNTAGFASDISIQYNHSNVEVVVDTFTLVDSSWNYLTQYGNLNVSYENEWLQQVDADLYVNPEGDDANSGLSEAEPLKTIQWALSKIKADSLNPRNIYLSEGIYSPESNNEKFALNMRAYVNIIGAGMNATILEEPVGNAAFIYGWYDNFIKLSSFTARNRAGANISPSPIQLSFSNSELSNILIENCYCIHASAIGSTENIVITDVKIINNKGMGAIVCGSYSYQEITAKLNNVIFIGNDQYEPSCGGGALSVSCRKYVSLTNCLFAKNHAYDNIWPKANIYLLENDTVDFFNNIVYNNTSNGGEISLGQGGTINIENSIISGNSSPYLFLASRGDEPTYVNISHSLIQGGTNPSILNFAGPEPYGVEFIWGEGIIDSIPQFLGGDEYDPLYYQLTSASPCIDTGTPDTTGLFLPPWDLLHNHRIWDGDNNGTAIIDMGCYEFGAEPYVEITNYQLPVTDYHLTNYPNPFNPETKIVFSLPEEGNVKLEIYNIKGQKVKTMMDCYTSPGDYELIWDGKDDKGKIVSSGVYFYQLVTERKIITKKMILLK